MGTYHPPSLKGKSLSMKPKNAVLLSPEGKQQRTQAAREPKRTGGTVQTRSRVGYHSISLVYEDDEHIPRIEIIADETVPEATVEFFRRMLKTMGDELGPRHGSRAPILGPTLVRSVVVLLNLFLSAPQTFVT